MTHRTLLPTKPWAKCNSCRAPIIWCETARKRERMPVDAEPVSNGNLALEQRWDGKQREFYLAAVPYEPLVHVGQPRYRSHFSSCPDAAAWRKRESIAVAVACPVADCGAAIPGRMFLCKKHWNLVPAALRREIGKLYVPGQETDRSLMKEGYTKAMLAAVAAAEEAEAG